MREPYKYIRKQIWWVGYVDADGTSKQKSTSCRIDEEAKAERVRLHVKKNLVARAEVAGHAGGPVTVRLWAQSWIESRRSPRTRETTVRNERTPMFLRLFDTPASFAAPSAPAQSCRSGRRQAWTRRLRGRQARAG